MNPKDKYKLHILESISRDIALSGEQSIYEVNIPYEISNSGHTIDDIKLELKDVYIALADFRKILANKILELKR